MSAPYECRCGKLLDGRQRQWCSDRCRVWYGRRDRMAPEAVHSMHERDQAAAKRRAADKAKHAAALDARKALCPCGKRATPLGARRPRTYCSDACRMRAQRERRRTDQQGIPCAHCAKTFTPKTRRARFCWPRCRSAHYRSTRKAAHE